VRKVDGVATKRFKGHVCAEITAAKLSKSESSGDGNIEIETVRRSGVFCVAAFDLRLAVLARGLSIPYVPRRVGNVVRNDNPPLPAPLLCETVEGPFATYVHEGQHLALAPERSFLLHSGDTVSEFSELVGRRRFTWSFLQSLTCELSHADFFEPFRRAYSHLSFLYPRRLHLRAVELSKLDRGRVGPMQMGDWAHASEPLSYRSRKQTGLRSLASTKPNSPVFALISGSLRRFAS